MTRDIPQIIRLGAGDDLARFFDAAVSFMEAFDEADDAEAVDVDTTPAGERLLEAFYEAKKRYRVVLYGRPGPAETDAQRRIRELRNLPHEEGG